MKKMELFLILALIAMQNPAEVRSQTIDKEQAIKEITDILVESGGLGTLAATELSYFETTYPDEINTVVNTVDPKSEFEKLKDAINKINEVEIEADTAKFCVYDAWKATYGALVEHEQSKRNCTSKSQLMKQAIIAVLHPIWEEIVGVNIKLATGLKECTSDKDKPDSYVIECLANVAKLRTNVETLKKQLNQMIQKVHTKAEETLTEQTKCLQKIEDFIHGRNHIVELLKTCVKDNAATTIYSTNVLYFCLCLFCVIRLI